METEEYKTGKEAYTTLGIALAGVYATAPNPWSDMASSITIYDRRLNAYLGDLVEGGVVIDKRTCQEETIIHGAFSGPMLQESLPKETCHSWEGARKCTDPTECGGWDYISLDLYLKLWEGLGARIGIRKGGEIHWNDGEIQTIPPASERWLQSR